MILRRIGQEARPRQRRIMELNPQHEIFIKMQSRFQADSEDPALSNYARLLLGYALLAEGSQLTDPVAFNRLLAELLAQTL
jgi:molecular chaperone HtpG